MWKEFIEPLFRKWGNWGKAFIFLVVVFYVVINVEKAYSTVLVVKNHLYPMPTATHIADIDYGQNDRFAFLFSFPKTWDRFDPLNGDGNRYHHPTESKISYSCWGSYNLYKESPLAINKKWLEQRAGYVLIDERYSGRFLVIGKSTNGTNMHSRVQIEGWRLVYLHKEIHNEKEVMMKSIELLIPYRSRIIGALCTAPKELFPAYEEFFLKLLSSIEVNISEEDNLMTNVKKISILGNK